MKKYIVFYNPLSQKGHGLENAEKLEKLLPDASLKYEDMTTVEDPSAYIRNVPADTEIVFTGGDGTLNRVVNALYGLEFDREIYYFPAGSGNDFVNDLGIKKEDFNLIPLGPYRKDLPCVRVNGEEIRFVNGVSCGLDGYCCEMNEILKKAGKVKSYTMIAFEGLMGKYRPCGAHVTVDGTERHYRKVWMIPTMYGSFYGGGVKMGPSQKRGNKEHTVTTVIVHDVSRIHALLLFLSVCNGRGEEHPKYIEYLVGHRVSVTYDETKALQYDGEPISGVKHYEVESL